MISTPGELRRVAELQAKATEGPWEQKLSRVVTYTDLYEGDPPSIIMSGYELEIASIYNDHDDAPFIAASRSLPLAQLADLWEAAEFRAECVEIMHWLASNRRPKGKHWTDAFIEASSCVPAANIWEATALAALKGAHHESE